MYSIISADLRTSGPSLNITYDDDDDDGDDDSLNE